MPRRRVGRLAAPESSRAPTVRANRQNGRELDRIEQQLSDALAAPVQVRVKKRTRRGEAGEIAIGFASLDELNGLLARLRSCLTLGDAERNFARVDALFERPSSTHADFGTLLANLADKREQALEDLSSRGFARATIDRSLTDSR